MNILPHVRHSWMNCCIADVLLLISVYTPAIKEDVDMGWNVIRVAECSFLFSVCQISIASIGVDLVHDVETILHFICCCQYLEIFSEI